MSQFFSPLAQGIAGSAVTVAAGAPLDAAILANPNAKVFLLDPSSTGLAGAQTLDLTKVIAGGVTSLSDLTIKGGATHGCATNFEAFAAVTVPNKCWAVKVTGLPTTANAISWTACAFEDTILTAPTNLGNPYTHQLMWGRNSADNRFTRVGFVDCTIGFTRANSGTTYFENVSSGETGALAVAWNSTGAAPKNGKYYIDLTAGASRPIAVVSNGGTPITYNPTSGVDFVAVTAGTYTITGGTVTSIFVGGVNTGLTAGSFHVNAAQAINVTWTVLPTFAAATDTVLISAVTSGVTYRTTLASVSTGDTLTWTSPTPTILGTSVLDDNNTNWLTDQNIKSTGKFLITGHFQNGILGVNAAGADNTGVTYGDWSFDELWVWAAGSELALDTEFSQSGALAGPNVSVGKATLTDIELGTMVNVPSFKAGEVRQHVTALRGGTCPVMRTFTVNPSGSLQTGFGYVEIDDLTVIQDDTPANGPSGNQVFIVTGSNTSGTNVPFYFKRFQVKSGRYWLNGNAATAVPFTFALNTAGVVNATVAEEIVFGETTLGYTSVPATPKAIWQFNATGDGAHTYTFNRVRPGKLTVLGATAAFGGFPATVGGTVITFPTTYGVNGQVNVFTDVEEDELDVSRVSGSWTATAPALHQLTNLPAPGSFGRLWYGPKNNPPLANLTADVSSTPGPTVTTVLTYAVQVDGTYDVGAFLDVSAFTTGVQNCRLTFTDTKGSVVTTKPWRGTAMSSGNSATNLGAVDTLSYAQTAVDAKAGTTITVDMNQTLVSTARSRVTFLQTA